MVSYDPDYLLKSRMYSERKKWMKMKQHQEKEDSK